MKKRLLKTVLPLLLCCVLLTLSLIKFTASADSAKKSEDIIILFENDVHCNIDGYSKLSALKNSLSDTYEYVGAVSVGDFLQGDTLGTVSKGGYIVEAMNLVGYDAIALGNHEFDYKLERLFTLATILETKPVCSNFYKIGEDTPVFDPYVIRSYGDTEVAFIGITTPDTLTSSSPVQFMDEKGNYIYTFSGTELSAMVQKAIDGAKAEGADFIVGLAHLGSENVFPQWSVQTLISETSGFDVVLDGHSHSVVESLSVNDKDGDPVVVSSTGTKFANIGKLTISESGVTTELIPTETLSATDPEIDEYISLVREEASKEGDRIVGRSEVELISFDEDGVRLIRNTETNLGDFCADAYRIVTGADVSVVNGGGIRADLPKGDITFNHLLSVHPYNNTVCAVEVTGQQILDLLELSVAAYPEENGSFQHVSGLTYTLNSYIPSSVVFDENMAFVSVSGERRVSDVKVLSKETGSYEPLEKDKLYTLASHNYLLLDHGSGATMLDNSKVVLNSGMLDVELLEIYVNEHLGGVIGKEYEASQMRVKVVNEKEDIPEEETPEEEKDNSLISPETGDKLGTVIILGLALLFFLTASVNLKKYKYTK